MKFVSSLFEIKNLFYEVGGQKILTNISLNILPGDYCAIIGPNGGGKTTLIRLLLGLEKPTKGAIKLFGQELGHFKRWHKIGYVPQDTNINTDFPIKSIGNVQRVELLARSTVSYTDAWKHLLDLYETDALHSLYLNHLPASELDRICHRYASDYVTEPWGFTNFTNVSTFARQWCGCWLVWH